MRQQYRQFSRASLELTFLGLLLGWGIGMQPSIFAQESPPTNQPEPPPKKQSLPFDEFWIDCPAPAQAATAQLVALGKPLAILTHRTHEGYSLVWGRDKTPEEKYLEFWVKCPVPGYVAAAQLVTHQNPLVLLAHRFCGKEYVVWGLELKPEIKARVFVPLDWHRSWNGKYVAAAQLVGVQEPFSVVALRQLGKERAVWGPEAQPLAEQAPPLHPDWLDLIRDNTPAPRLDKRLPDEWTNQEIAYLKLFAQGLANTRFTPPEVFVESAEENKHITWAHLFNNSNLHRGKIIPVKGMLVRLRKAEAPYAAKPLIKHYYEGWVQMETEGSNPVCVIFAQKPEGVPLQEDGLRENIRFNGYYIKRYLYISGKGPRNTLLFMAPTFETTDSSPLPPPSRDLGIPGVLTGGIIILLGVVVVVFLSLFAINFWFRRDDAKVRARIAAIQEKKFGSQFQDLGTESASNSSNEEAENFPSFMEDEPSPETNFSLSERKRFNPPQNPENPSTEEEN